MSSCSASSGAPSRIARAPQGSPASRAKASRAHRAAVTPRRAPAHRSQPSPVSRLASTPTQERPPGEDPTQGTAIPTPSRSTTWPASRCRSSTRKTSPPGSDDARLTAGVVASGSSLRILLALRLCLAARRSSPRVPALQSRQLREHELPLERVPAHREDTKAGGLAVDPRDLPLPVRVNDARGAQVPSSLCVLTSSRAATASKENE